MAPGAGQRSLAQAARRLCSLRVLSRLHRVRRRPRAGGIAAIGAVGLADGPGLLPHLSACGAIAVAVSAGGESSDSAGPGQPAVVCLPRSGPCCPALRRSWVSVRLSPFCAILLLCGARIVGRRVGILRQLCAGRLACAAARTAMSGQAHRPELQFNPCLKGGFREPSTSARFYPC